MKIILPALRLVEAPKAPPADNYLYLEFVAGGSVAASVAASVASPGFSLIKYPSNWPSANKISPNIRNISSRSGVPSRMLLHSLL